MRWIVSVIIGIFTAMMGVSPFKNDTFNLNDFIILSICVLVWNAVYEFNVHINKIKGNNNEH